MDIQAEQGATENEPIRVKARLVARGYIERERALTIPKYSFQWGNIPQLEY